MSVRERIIKSGYEKFYAFGVRGVSMDEIAKSAAISKKTIYQHFSGKDELIRAVVLYKIEQRKHFIEQRLSKIDGVLESLVEINKYFSEEVKNLNPLLIHDLNVHYPTIFKEINTFHEEVFGKICIQNLKLGMKKGIYRKNLEPKIIGKLWFTTIQFFFDQQFIHTFGMAHINDTIFEHFIYGILEHGDSKNLIHFQKIIQNN